MSKSKQLDPVAQVIAEARRDRALMPTPEGVEALKRVLQHNDNCKNSERVGKERAVKMLADHFGWTGREQALEAVCRELGRKSFTRAS